MLRDWRGGQGGFLSESKESSQRNPRAMEATSISHRHDLLRHRINPAYVDVAIERWQAFTGEESVLAETGESIAALRAKRMAA